MKKLINISTLILAGSLSLPATALNGFGDIDFGARYNDVAGSYKNTKGFKQGTDKVKLEKYVSFKSKVFELDTKIRVNFSNDMANSIIIDFERGAISNLNDCRTRFNQIVNKLKTSNSEYKLVTNGESFEGMVTDNAYLVFNNQRHIHAQMQFFASDCGTSIYFENKPPRFFR